MTNDELVNDILEDNLESSIDSDKKIHPWRKCPLGYHLVREHITHVHPSKKHPDGKVSIWHEHCARNQSHKDQLSYAEIRYITKTFFATLSGPPTAGALTKIFSKADDFDVEIRGWVQYWNDIFKPDDPLDPNLVKALIGSESSFDPMPEEYEHVYGLMQIKSETLDFLSDKKFDLKNYLIKVSKKELLDSSVNICAGVRWLFRERQTASAMLERKASWEEAVIAYKGYWDQVEDGEDPEGMQRFRKFLKILQGE